MKHRLRLFVRTKLKRTVKRLDQPFPALPLAVFRVGAGLLSAAYFWRLRQEVDDISSPDGVIDHQFL